MTVIDRVTDRVMVVLLTGFVATGTGTLALAVAGAAEPWAVLLVVALLWSVLLLAWGREPSPGPPVRHRPVLVLLGLAVIVASTAHNLRHQGEYVVTDRDSGIYVVGGG